MPQNGQQQATPALAPAADEGQATHDPLPLYPCHCLTRSLHVIICNLFAQVHPHHVAATVAVATLCRVCLVATRVVVLALVVVVIALVVVLRLTANCKFKCA